MAKKPRTPIDVLSQPLSPQTAERFRTTIIYLCLSIFLVFVSLPLFWMVLTAFKTKGTAFQLSFWPQTTLTHPTSGRDPYPEPNQRAALLQGEEELRIEAGLEDRETALLHVEYYAPQATSVVAITQQALSTQNSPIEVERAWRMRRAFNGIWYGLVEGYSEEEIEVSFEINEEQVVTDPGMPEGGYFLEPGIIHIGGLPEFLVVREQGQVRARIGRVDPEHRVFARFQGGERHALEHVGEGYFEGDFPAENFGPFRVIEKRSFGAALSEKYTITNFTAIIGNEDFDFARYFLNSLIVATSSAFLTVLICSLASFAFAVFPFHYREGLFYALLTSMLVPGMIYMVPQFSITIQLGLMNTYSGMVVPHLANVFGLFLMRQYIDQIPRDLFAAAEIDGARDYQIFNTIVVPICLPIMMTLFLLVFVMQWSNFLWQLIVNTGTSEVLTLPVGLQQFKGQNANEWEKIMAGACFSILPITALFFSLQKYFLQGLTAGSVKE